MTRNTRIGIAVLTAVAAVVTAGSLYRSTARDAEPPVKAADKESPDAVEVRKTAEQFGKAFNKGDAEAMAAFWVKDAEYVGPDGEVLRGRKEIEKAYGEFFKKNPKAAIEVEIESIRLLGRHTALEEGTLKLVLAGESDSRVSRYSVLHVREDDRWRMVSVREWVPNPDELITLKDVEWLLGEWVAKSDDSELRTKYSWDEDRAFIRCRYTLKKDGKVVASGTQTIGKDPSGGLRSWLFDASGTYGESHWTRDGKRWVIEAGGTLPDGSTTSAVNLLVPLGKDSFTWQSTERSTAGASLADMPPVKVTRVKSEK